MHPSWRRSWAFAARTGRIACSCAFYLVRAPVSPTKSEPFPPSASRPSTPIFLPTRRRMQCTRAWCFSSRGWASVHISPLALISSLVFPTHIQPTLKKVYFPLERTGYAFRDKYRAAETTAKRVTCGGKGRFGIRYRRRRIA